MATNKELKELVAQVNDVTVDRDHFKDMAEAQEAQLKEKELVMNELRDLAGRLDDKTEELLKETVELKTTIEEAEKRALVLGKTIATYEKQMSGLMDVNSLYFNLLKKLADK